MRSCPPRSRPIVLALIAAAVLAVATTTAAVELQPFLTGLSRPVYVTSARDGTDRRFIVEQGGVIKVLQPGAPAPTVFLDITARVESGGERGLLGLAFHPRFAVNGRFFVNYTRDRDGATVIAEYRALDGVPDVAEPTEHVLLTVAQPFANHNGGMIEFGPDGFLYIAMGDGGAGNDPGKRAQDLNQLLGKILRIDVDRPSGLAPYSSPPDNPYFGATPGRDEIYASGMRNPWRLSFDRETGDLYAGDVGQGRWEEVDIVTKGGNYGWQRFEGHHCTGSGSTCDTTGLTFPVVEYDHAGGRCAVTGGYVYRGARATLADGTYVFGDFCSGEIFTLSGGAPAVLLDSGVNVSSFGEDEAGEIYVVGLGGTVHRLTSSPPRAPCTYAIDPARETFDDAGGTGAANLTTADDCGWAAASHADWITLTSAARGTGGATVTYTVAADGGAGRLGFVAVGGRRLRVVQGAVCDLQLAPFSQQVGYAGGSAAVHVTDEAGTTVCPWAATSLAPWITITSGTPGSGDGQVGYEVAGNPTRKDRKGVVTIGPLALTVNQAGAPSNCKYNVASPKQSTAAGGAGSFTVKAQSWCSWSAQSQASWITIVSGTGQGNGTGTFVVDPNTTGAIRRGIVTIAGKNVTVKQVR